MRISMKLTRVLFTLSSTSRRFSVRASQYAFRNMWASFSVKLSDLRGSVIFSTRWAKKSRISLLELMPAARPRMFFVRVLKLDSISEALQ